MNRAYIICFLGGVLFLFLISCQKKEDNISPFIKKIESNPEILLQKKDEICVDCIKKNPEPRIEIVKVKPKSSLYNTLLKAGIDTKDIFSMLRSAQNIYDLDHLRPETTIELWSDPNTYIINKVRVFLSAIQIISFEKNKNSEWAPSEETKQVTTTNILFAGKVETSFWASASTAGIDPKIIEQFFEIFAWQIDFERSVQPGDSWGIAIEKNKVDDKFYKWGLITGAFYKLGDETYTAIRHYDTTNKKFEYYDLDGYSLQGTFLKSPVRYDRISSFFKKSRYHPILKTNKPHLGVDYAAAHGTPVRTVGDGLIIEVSQNPLSGRVIKIRHNNVYQTAYKHLSKFNTKFKKGSRVAQGDIIGFVGSSGLATGPHLHFEFYENGKYIDPLGRKFPGEKKINPNLLSSFKLSAKQVVSQLLPNFIKL